MTASNYILEGFSAVLVGSVGRLLLFALGALALSIPAFAIAVMRRAVRRARNGELLRVGEITYRDDVFHAPTHTWLAPQGDGLAVGLDDFGQRLLPSVTAIEMNEVGSRVKRGEPLAVLHAGLLSVRIPAPVDGTVLAVNNGAKNNPGRVKSEPARTWLLKLAPSEPSYLRFPCGEATRTWLRAEEARLAHFWEGELGLDAADGGGPLPQSVVRTGEDELAFARLVGAFLEA